MNAQSPRPEPSLRRIRAGTDRPQKAQALPPAPEPEPPASADTIAPGRRLVRVEEGPPGLGARLGAVLRRLAWRSPAQGLKLRGRYPLRLTAVPRDPVAPDAAAAAAIAAGKLAYAGAELPLADLRFDAALPSREFAEVVQTFRWFRELAVALPRERASRIAEAAVAGWLETHAAKVDEEGWRVDRWGERLLFWAAYAPLILSSRDLVYRSAVLNTMARGARYLESEASRAPVGLSRVAAQAGLLAAGLVLQGGPSRVRKAEAGLVKALSASQHDDGGLASRSPLEQAHLVDLLLQVRAAYLAARQPLPDALGEALAAAAAALAGTTMGDGALGSWQGGNPGDPARVAALLEAAGGARPLRTARGWGYQRLLGGRTAVTVDAAPPPAARPAHGGCASTLAFELSDGEQRLVVNCGGAGGRATVLGPDILHALRSTAAHSTLCLFDSNSTSLLPGGALGKGVSEVELTRDDGEGGSRVEATHTGYVRRFGLAHKRRLELSADGHELRGQDNLLPSGRRRIRDAAPFAIRFHLGAGTQISVTADGLGALLRLSGGSAWQFRVRGAMLAVEDSLWLDGEARPHGTQQLVVAGETPAGGAEVSWHFKKIG